MKWVCIAGLWGLKKILLHIVNSKEKNTTIGITVLAAFFVTFSDFAF